MLLFYTTEGCHLCDQALQVLNTAASSEQLPGNQIAIEMVDVALDESAFERFGERIPVLEDDGTGALLCWPFDEIAATQYLLCYLEQENAQS